MVKVTCNKKHPPFKIALDLLPYTELLTVPDFKFGCRHGECGTCLIEVECGEEHLSPPTKQEKATLAKLKASLKARLACQVAVTGGTCRGQGD